MSLLQKRGKTWRTLRVVLAEVSAARALGVLAMALVALTAGCGLSAESGGAESTGAANTMVSQASPVELGMTINIAAGLDAQSSSVSVSGRLEHIITDNERRAFGIEDAQLKGAINAYFGRSPSDAFVRSPTPWGDLYKTYNWPEVRTVLVPKSAQILEVTSEPVVVARNIFRNNYNYETTFNTSITHSVSNTSESHWTYTTALEFSQALNYSLSFLGAGAGGETRLTYTNEFGSGASQSTTYTVGSTNGATVVVPPGWGVQSVLSASKGRLKVRITYEARLEGCTAVNYYPAYQGHYFWCLDIGAVMQAGGISNSIEYTEDIEVGFFSNAEISVERYMDLAFSYAGPITGKPYCTLMNEPGDPHYWDNNYLCSSINYGLQFSYAGPIAGMRCTLINEPGDPHYWDNNYLCVPESNPLTLSWSWGGPIAGKECTRVFEPGDPYYWDNNYLCY